MIFIIILFSILLICLSLIYKHINTLNNELNEELNEDLFNHIKKYNYKIIK